MALLLAIEGSVSSAGLFKAAKLPPDGFAQLQTFLMSHTEIANSAFTNGHKQLYNRVCNNYLGKWLVIKKTFKGSVLLRSTSLVRIFLFNVTVQS